MVPIRHSIEESVERLEKAAQSVFGNSINFDSSPHKHDPYAVGSADHPLTGRRANVILKNDVILINDFKSEPFTLRLDKAVGAASAVSGKLSNAATVAAGPTLADFQDFHTLANLTFSVADEAVACAISAKRGWTQNFTQSLIQRGLLTPVRLRIVAGERKDFHSLACNALIPFSELSMELQAKVAGSVTDYGLFVGGLNSLYRMGYVISYSPMVMELRKYISSLEVRGISEDLLDPEDAQGGRVTNALALPHSYVSHKYISAEHSSSKLFMVEAAAKGFTVMHATGSDVVALNSFSDFLKLSQSEVALEALKAYAANKQRVIIILDPVAAKDRGEQKQFASRLASALKAQGIAASILVSTHKAVDEQLLAGTYKHANISELVKAGLDLDQAKLLSFCQVLETTESVISYDLAGASMQEWLGAAAAAHHNPRSRAEALNVPIQAISGLDEVRAAASNAGFLYVRDISGTGVGKSHNSAEVALAAAAGTLSRKHKLNQLMLDHQILYTVGTYDTIPAALIGHPSVRIVRGRTDRTKVVIETSNGRVLMDEAESEGIVGKVVAELKGNCENYENYEKARRFKSVEQANSDAANFCRACDKRSGCQYVTDQAALRSGAMPEHIIVTANANRANVVEALASAGSLLKPTKLVMIDDDLNLLRDTEELSLNQLVDSFVSMDSNTIEGAVADAFRSVVNEMKYKVRPFTVLPKEGVPEGLELLEGVAGIPDVLDKAWLKTVQGNRDNVHMSLTLDSQDYFLTGVAQHLLSRGVTHSAMASMDPDLIREALPAMILPNCKELDKMQPAIQAMLDPAMQNLAKLSYVAEYFSISEVKLPVIKCGQREEVQALVRKALGPNVNDSSVQFQREVTKRLQDCITEYVSATEYSFRNVDIRILFSRTDPTLFKRHAAAVIQLSADESWNSHRVYGKLPDVLVERATARTERPVAMVIGGFCDRFFRANESSRATDHFAMAELVARTAAEHAGVAVPAELRTAIFADKRIKDGVAQKVDSDATFQQYFGDEVGKNSLFNQNINCILAFPQKNLNLGVANLTSGISTIDTIEVHKDLDGQTIWTTSDFSNVYERSIQLNQTYGRLRSNRREDASLFVAFGEEVFLDEQRFDVRRVGNPFEFKFDSVWSDNEGLAMASSADARKAVEVAYAISQSVLEDGTVAEWVMELAGCAGKGWITEQVFGYIAAGKRAIIERSALLLAAIKAVAWHVSANGSYWTYQSFSPLLKVVDSSIVRAVLELLAVNADTLSSVFSSVAKSDYLVEVSLCHSVSFPDGVSDPVGQPNVKDEDVFAFPSALSDILVDPPFAAGEKDQKGLMLKSCEPYIKGKPVFWNRPQFNLPSPSPQSGMQLCSGINLMTTPFDRIKQDPYFHQLIGEHALHKGKLTRKEVVEVIVHAELHRLNGRVEPTNSPLDNYCATIYFPVGNSITLNIVGTEIEVNSASQSDGMGIAYLNIPSPSGIEMQGWLFGAYRSRRALARFSKELQVASPTMYRIICKQLGSDLLMCVDAQLQLPSLDRLQLLVEIETDTLLSALALRMCC